MISTVYRQVHFLKSAEKLSQCPEDVGFEVAFAGRSNAGKSSAINTLTDNKKLARTSKTPGRTQLINFFRVDDDRRLVDLPGYGYAKVSEAMKLNWQRHLSDYLQNRQCLQGIVLLMDIRHPLQEFDMSVLAWAQEASLAVHLVLTKSDKLKPNAARNQLMAVKKRVAGMEANATVQMFSSLKKQGVDELSQKLDQWLQMPEIN